VSHIEKRKGGEITMTEVTEAYNGQGRTLVGSDGGSDGASDNGQSAVGEIGGKAQEKAQQTAGQAQTKLREQLDQRSSQAASQINEQAADLRSVGDSLREQGKDGPANAADRLAQYAEKVGGYLQENDSHALLADAEDFGRQQPWAVAAVGLALGVTASRFLKASSSQRYHGRTTVPRAAGVYPTGSTNGVAGGELDSFAATLGSDTDRAV
jgi:hypothetical protein